MRGAVKRAPFLCYNARMKKIRIDLPELQLLSEAMLALSQKMPEKREEPEEAEKIELAEKLDPLLDKILQQAQAQIEETEYVLELSDEEGEKTSSLLSEALALVAEDGDIILIGQLGEILSKFSS